MEFKIYFKLLFLVFFLACSKTKSGGNNSGDNNNIDDNPSPGEEVVGHVLPDWQEGELDIHAINTGRGECTFFIFPDGTTMMVDASSSLIAANNTNPPPPRKPNDNITSGRAISDYIKHFLPKKNQKLNYILLSHFHPDHMGGYNSSLPSGPGGTFRKSGVTEVGVDIPFDKIIDRGYPNYDYPQDMKSTSLMSNYIKFINWAKGAYNASAEQFEVGRNDQIVLKETPSKYNNFKIQNLAVNGKVWTGEGLNWVRNFPEEQSILLAASPDENIFCDVFQLSYGKFDYFSGGDIQYNGKTENPWKDIEEPIANIVSEVEVMKANHHGTSNTNSSALLNKLKPNVVLTHVWRDVHPNPATINRFYSAYPSSKIFLTNLVPSNRITLGESIVSSLRGTQGHIVVRVKPGGDEYSVYVLDDSNQNYKVTNESGPFKSE